MSREAQRPGTAGFALTESLVSLLLLAIALMGAAAALVESLAAQQAALLQTRAADLASDLSETLRAGLVPTVNEEQVLAWRESVEAQLPGAVASLHYEAADDASAAATVLPARFHIRLQWREQRAGRDNQLELPVHPPAHVAQ